jgi:hypothetical protein
MRVMTDTHCELNINLYGVVKYAKYLDQISDLVSQAVCSVALVKLDSFLVDRSSYFGTMKTCHGIV